MKRVPRARSFALVTLGVFAAHGLLLTAVVHFRPHAAQRAMAPAWVTRAVAVVVPDAIAAPTPEALPVRPPVPARASKPSPATAPSAAPRAEGAPEPQQPVAASSPEAVQVAAGKPARQREGEAAPHAATYRVAPTAKLHYKVVASAKGFELQGEGELDWRNDGSTYEARLTLSSPLLPKREQRSSGQVTKEGLAPERFSDKSRTEEAAHFQRDQGKVSFSNNRPDVALAPGAQDRLSIILQLGALLAGERRRHPPGSTVTIQTASTRDAEPWVFTVEKEERLELPGGTVPVLKLIRNPRKEFDQRVELWLAPGMDYVPVRVRLTNPNGEWVDQQWSSTDKG